MSLHRVAQPAPRITPEQLQAVGQLARRVVNLDSLRENRLPSAAAGSALMGGDFTQVVPVASMFLGRAAQIALGIFLAGEWDERSVKNALAGSAAVQAFLFAYVWAHKDADLPSGESAKDLLAGKEGALPRLVAHWVARSGLIGLGMYLAGQRKELAKQALFGGAVIEASVLSWAASQQAKGVP